MCPFFCGILLAAALLLLALTVLPLLPVNTLVTDTAAHFMPVYPVAALVLLLLALLTLSPGAVVVVSALTVLLAVWQLRPVGAADPIKTAAPGFTILQANILRTTTDMAALERMIRNSRADLIAMQEANSHAGTLLDTLKDLYPHQERALQDQHSFGMAVASRQPLADFEQLTFTQPHMPVFRFTQTLAGKTIDVVTVHPANPLHDFPSRSFDLQGLAGYLDEKEETPRIVTGDFNVTPFALDYRLFTQRLALSNARDIHGILRHYTQGTWPQWLPAPLRLSIDHTLHTPELRVMRHDAVPDSIGSDHLASITTLTLR